MAKARNLTQQEIQNLIEDRKAGLGITELTKKYGVSQYKVYAIVGYARNNTPDEINEFNVLNKIVELIEKLQSQEERLRVLNYIKNRYDI